MDGMFDGSCASCGMHVKRTAHVTSLGTLVLLAWNLAQRSYMACLMFTPPLCGCLCLQIRSMGEMSWVFITGTLSQLVAIAIVVYDLVT
jgi:hypothetical protein